MPVASGMESKRLQLAGMRNQKAYASCKRAATTQTKPTAAMGAWVQEDPGGTRETAAPSTAHLENHRTTDSLLAFLLRLYKSNEKIKYSSKEYKWRSESPSPLLSRLLTSDHYVSFLL